MFPALNIANRNWLSHCTKPVLLREPVMMYIMEQSKFIMKEHLYTNFCILPSVILLHKYFSPLRLFSENNEEKAILSNHVSQQCLHAINLHYNKTFPGLFRNLQGQGVLSFEIMVSVSSHCRGRRENYCKSTLLGNVQFL